MAKKAHIIFAVLVAVALGVECLFSCGQVYGLTENELSLPKTIKVGWYENEGFFDETSSGLKAGYGYEYLQKMAQYGGWKYEYVKGTKAQCVEMLQKGEIDILGGIAYTDQTDGLFAFSNYDIQESYTVLLSAEHDDKYAMEDYAAFDGMRVGIIPGIAQVSWLSSHAKEKGFSFTPVAISDEGAAKEALQRGYIDAMMVSYAEIAGHRGRIIDQFSPIKQYFVAAKGNVDMVNALDYALEQIDKRCPEFRIELETKYYNEYKGHKMALSLEEKTLLENTKEIRITLSSLRKPMMFKEEGEYKGIFIDILRKVEDALGIRFVFVEAKNQLEAVELVKSGQADFLSNIYTDFGWAEHNDLLLSGAYMDLDYAAIVREGSRPDSKAMRVAAVKGYLFSQNYVEKKYPEDQILWYDSEEDCVKAVKNGEADICFANTYVANTYIQDPKYKGLYSAVINYSHGLSLAAPVGSEQAILISAVDKAIASIGQDEVYSIIAANTMFMQHNLSFYELILRYPFTFAVLFGIFAVLAASLLALYFISRNNRVKNLEIYKAKLSAQTDSITGIYNRLAFELLCGDKIATHQGGAFIMIDIDNFKSINDTWGHGYGDEVLKVFAERMRSCFKESKGILGRMGGDEFAVFLSVFTSREDVYAQLKEFKSQSSILHEEGLKINFSISIGISFSPEDGEDFDSLYKSADIALYAAKRAGKNAIEIFDNSYSEKEARN